MTYPKTLLELAGADLKPAKMRDAVLVLVDFQNEYLSGPLALPDAARAVSRAAQLLSTARETGAPIIHVAHKGPPGGLFDRTTERGQIVVALAPRPGETIIEKGLPNAFAGTDLHGVLGKSGRKNLIVAGFMTHMCVSSTARAAVELGYRITIDASSCATRDLPDGQGGRVEADIVHKVALAELSDRFAIVARNTGELM